ncbi:MAG: protein translocase subunit SecD [Thermoleophilia bacterium]|nr:protein translocase subunit SecD [Thermoleophilia bacterium]
MRRHLNIIILAVVAALVGVALYFIIPPGDTTFLGLDLQGGLEVVYEARTNAGEVPTADQLEQTLSIIDRRVNGLGVSESTVQQQGADQISIQLPGVTDAQQALAIVGKTAQLEFFKNDPAARPIGPVESREAAIAEAAKGDVPEADIEQFREGYDNTEDWALVVEPAQTVTDAEGEEQVIPEAWYVYRRPPELTGAAIASARQSYDQFNRPNVLIDFTSEGSTEFQQVTKELWRDGLRSGESATFAIVLDNVVESAPRIDHTDPTLRDGISGGAEISGSFTLAEAKDLALVLNTGALPVQLEPIQQAEVSATLGKDSLRAGLAAGIVGLALVLVYMVAFYRFLGVVADLALIVYAILFWGLLNAIPVTLTLPGIAGMILTIGVAADANVVIFERIKEEVRQGKTVRSAINAGYSRGFRTILDANILTILTAAVLFYFATAQPKGFAFTLMLGVATSMLTAVLFTRALLGVMSRIRFFARPAFLGVTGEIAAPSTQGSAAPAGARARASRRASAGARDDGRGPAVAVEALEDDAASGDDPDDRLQSKPAVAATGGTKSAGARRNAARKRKKRK